MSRAQGKRLLILVILCAGIVSATIVFGMRAVYSPGTRFVVATFLLAVIFTSAFALGTRATLDGPDDRKLLSISGLLLIAPMAFFSLLAGIGPPGGQSAEENHLRYLILLVSSIANGAGFVLLRQALVEGRERFFSSLGFAAIVVATPLYVVWGAVMLEFYREAAPAVSGIRQPWQEALADLSDILLFFAGILTYLATVAFAAALARTRLLKRGTGAAVILASFAAILVLAFRGLRFPNPEVAFEHWYTIPGFIVSIPAVPWMMPCVLGVILLWRAGDAEYWSGDAIFITRVTNR